MQKSSLFLLFLSGFLYYCRDATIRFNALERALDMGDTESRGYAAHNLAVVYEILGDFEKAREWAEKAWAQYGNKESKDYAYQLNQRIRNQQRLQNQME